MQTVAQLVVISGRSGSGKSTALHVLEDLGYYCIDNLPASLIPNLVERSKQQKLSAKIAVSIDARNSAVDLEDFPLAITKIQDIDVRVIFLDAASPTLIKRFSETRRKHPLSNQEMGLKEALNVESQLLDGLAMMAALKIDTTHMTLHQLRDEVRDRVANTTQSTTIMFQSFAFKHGVPVDADFVFDARFLPNPHWVPHLRPLTGLDSEVAAFLSAEEEVNGFERDLIIFLGNLVAENNKEQPSVHHRLCGLYRRTTSLGLLNRASRSAIQSTKPHHSNASQGITSNLQAKS
jgi:UPF0042 nucleotide-binding protein